jgi:hypothetical protein
MRLLPFIFLTSCTTTGLSSTSPLYPRASLTFAVEGVAFTGVAAVKRKPIQKISVYTPKDSPYLFFTTCHRETVTEKPSTLHEFTYYPQFWVEDTPICLMKLTVISPQGKTLLGFIDPSSEDDVPYALQCNGLPLNPIGNGMCQARAGLVQRVTFSVPTTVEAAQGCNAPKKDGYSYEVALSPGLCLYLFRTSPVNGQPSGKFARLTTYGYTEAL